MTTATPVRTASSPPPSRAGRVPLWWHVVSAVVVVALVAFSVLLLIADDTDELDVVRPPAASTGPSVQPSAQPPADPVDRSTAVWPTEGTAGYAEPVGAARAFATGYLGFPGPVIGAFQQGDSRSGEVEVRPIATGPATTVLLRQLSGEESWSVLGAVTEGISVTEPAALEVVSSPVTVRGEAWTFEGHVSVQVRQDGTTAPIGEGYVTGGGDQLRPFTGSIPFTVTADHGALVFLTQSAKDGSAWQAAALRVAFR